MTEPEGRPPEGRCMRRVRVMSGGWMQRGAGKGRKDGDLSSQGCIWWGVGVEGDTRVEEQVLVCSRKQSDGHTSLHKGGRGLSLWSKIAGGRILEGGTGHRAQVHCGPVGVHLAGCCWPWGG